MRQSGDQERDPLTESIIGAAIEVHRHLGPGLLESTNETCLALELRGRGVGVERQVAIPVLTYLKLTSLKTALILNFNRELLRDGVRRLVR